MKNTKISLLDQDQLMRQVFDVENDAQRVILVGSDGQQIADSIKESLKDLKIEFPKSENSMETVKTVYLPDHKILEVPVIVKELQIKEIEKPIIVTEVKIIEIEKPIIVPEVRIIEIEKQVIVKEQAPMSSMIKWILIVQTLATLVRVFFEIVHIK